MVKLVGVSDEQELACTVHDDGVAWTQIGAKRQRAQEGRYTLIPEGNATPVRFDVKKGAESMMDTAAEILRKRVLEIEKRDT